MTGPRRDEGTLPGGQFWQGWTPDAPVGVVVLVHGLHEHGGRYAARGRAARPGGVRRVRR